MSSPSSSGSGEGSPPAQGSQEPQGQMQGHDDIDLQALAEKVVRLLKDEARLERERLGRRPLG